MVDFCLFLPQFLTLIVLISTSVVIDSCDMNKFHCYLLCFLLAEFAFVKELTLDVQNIIAPPKQKLPSAVNTKALDNGSPTFVASPKSDHKSEKPSDDKSEKPQTTDEQGVGNGSVYNKSEDESAKSAPNSPFASSTIGSPHRDFVDSDIRKIAGEDSSPRDQDAVQETQRYGF